MPSQKPVVAFRLNPDEEEFVDRIAAEMRIPRARVLALALRVLKKRLEEPTANALEVERVLQAVGTTTDSSTW